MRGDRYPQLNIRYPMKMGSTLRRRSSGAGGPRSILSLKFTEIPEKASLARAGTLTSHADKIAVDLCTQDASSSVRFAGTRSARKSGSNVHDYVLVVSHDRKTVWLERVADSYPNVRPVDAARADRPPPDLAGVQATDDDRARDPDSWMAEAGSPVTPDDADAMDDVAAPLAHPRHAGKSTPPSAAPRRKLVSALAAHAPHVAEPHVASKTVAQKSVAGKAPSSRRRDDDDDEGSDADGSSSEDDDDSDDSDSSDSDSENSYTSRSSSDEE